MTVAFAEEVAYVRELGHLSEQDIARATGAGRSTVGALRGTRQQTGDRAERIAELAAIVERLACVWTPLTLRCGSTSPSPCSTTTSRSTCLPWRISACQRLDRRARVSCRLVVRLPFNSPDCACEGGGGGMSLRVSTRSHARAIRRRSLATRSRYRGRVLRRKRGDRLGRVVSGPCGASVPPRPGAAPGPMALRLGLGGS